MFFGLFAPARSRPLYAQTMATPQVNHSSTTKGVRLMVAASHARIDLLYPKVLAFFLGNGRCGLMCSNVTQI